MRVVGGIAKGRKLASPAIAGARPTSELVRGAIFNIVHPQVIEGAAILDLYAGCGSLGIEGLSRGARWADFVEQDPRQCTVIRANLASAGFVTKGQVHWMTVERALRVLDGPYRTVLMDPPYRLAALDLVLDMLNEVHLLEVGGMVVVGHSKRLVLKERHGSLYQVRSRRHGDSVVDFFKAEGPNDGGCLSGHL